MLDFEVILGMDRLCPHRPILNCYTKTITLAFPGIPLVLWQGTYSYSLLGILSFLQAQWLVPFKFFAYIVYVCDTIDLVPMVLEFINVFPTNLPGLPP